MKKIILSAILILLVFPLFSDPVWTNTSASGVMEAYKELPPSAMMKFDINLSNSKQSSIFGSSLSDRLSDSDFSSDKWANALTVTVDSNRRNPISVSIWFSPFISTAETGNKKVSATWTKETTSTNTIDHDTVTDEETGETYDRYFMDDTGLCYRYSMDITLKNNSGGNITSATASTTAGASLNLKFTPKAESNRRSGNGWAGNWKTVQNIPTLESGVLPGIVEDSEAAIHATAVFSMTIGTSYSDLLPNTRYTSTVRITIQGD